MKYLFTFLFCVISFVSEGQVSVGFRGGATYWFSSQGIPDKTQYYYPQPELHWDKDLVLRYAIKRWAFELSLNHRKYSDGESEYINNSNNPYLLYRYWIEKRTTDQFVLSTIAQYNYSCAGKRKQFRNYIGLALGTHYYRYKDERTAEYALGGIDHKKSINDETRVWPGIHHTITFDINKTLQLNSQILYRYFFVPPWNGYMQINSQLGIGIGASYRITP